MLTQANPTLALKIIDCSVQRFPGQEKCTSQAWPQDISYHSSYNLIFEFRSSFERAIAVKHGILRLENSWRGVLNRISDGAKNAVYAGSNNEEACKIDRKGVIVEILMIRMYCKNFILKYNQLSSQLLSRMQVALAREGRFSYFILQLVIFVFHTTTRNWKCPSSDACHPVSCGRRA